MLLGTYNRAGAVTFSGLVLAVAACVLSYHQKTAWAMICLIYSGVCDLLDGWVARKRNRSAAEKSFGLQIDSLADMTAFGVTPMMILMSMGFDRWLDFFLFSGYVSAAAMRLAFFNQTQMAAQAPALVYTGLPVTYAALIFPSLLLLQGFLAPTVFGLLVRLVVGAMALLFVLRIPIPKPRAWAYPFFLLLAAGLTAVWLWKG